MNVNTQPQHDMEDEELDEFDPLPEPGEMEALFTAIKPVLLKKRRKQRVKKAVKRVTAAACILLLASLAINRTMQPTALTAGDGLAQTPTIVRPVAQEHLPVNITQQGVVPGAIAAVHQQRPVRRRKQVVAYHARNARQTERSPEPGNTTIAVYSGEQIPLPSNTEPVTGTRLFTAGPGEPIVTLSTPNK